MMIAAGHEQEAELLPFVERRASVRALSMAVQPTQNWMTLRWRRMAGSVQNGLDQFNVLCTNFSVLSITCRSIPAKLQCGAEFMQACRSQIAEMCIGHVRWCGITPRFVRRCSTGLGKPLTSSTIRAIQSSTTTG
jgi:hypothetical protein